MADYVHGFIVLPQLLASYNPYTVVAIAIIYHQLARTFKPKDFVKLANQH